jgi:hypothetical protein
MRSYKRLVAWTGCIAALTAGTVLLATIDGASARDGAHIGGDMPSSVTNRIRNTIRPIIYDPGHKSDRCHEHHRCPERFLGPPVPAPYPAKPIVAAPGNTVPVKTIPVY